MKPTLSNVLLVSLNATFFITLVGMHIVIMLRIKSSAFIVEVGFSWSDVLCVVVVIVLFCLCFVAVVVFSLFVCCVSFLFVLFRRT